MTLPIIFCPQCDTLILEAEQCPTCHWRRPGAGSEVGKPAWAVALEAKLPSQASYPLASNGCVYIPTENGHIVALDSLESDPDNVIKWRHQITSRYRCHGLVAWNEYILLGNEFAGGFPTPPGELILLNAENGDEVWRHSVEGASLSVPAVHNNIALFSVNSGWLYAVDLEARQELWRQKIYVPWSWAPTAPMLTPSGLLLLTGRSNQLVAFDIEKRDVAWTFSGGGWFALTPVWVDGTVYARCWDRHIYAIDGTNGQEIWRYKASRDYSSDLWVNETYLYIGVKDYQAGAEQGSGTYALYTLDRRTGKRLGRYEVPGHVFARPVATDEAVFFATDDRSPVIESQGTFYALDARGQELLWEPYVVEQRFQSDLLLVGDWVIAGTRQGAVYAIPWQVEEAITETPQAYADRGEWEKTAIAYALRGEYPQAAEIYADRLDHPLQAGRLYLHAGENRRVVALLGHSKKEAERELAIKAAQTMPELDEQARALADMGEDLAAAEIYVEAGNLEEAGDCYLEAQSWQKAQNAYAEAQAWGKWEKVARERELWQDLVDRYVEVGDYAQAAEVQLGLGHHLEAATYYDQAGMAAEALSAYRALDPANMTEEVQQRILALAEQTGQLEAAIKVYKVLDQLAKAAEMAEGSGHYNQALALYREAGEQLKVAEMLEKQSRFADAAETYEQASRYGQAAQDFERQVEREIERAGGMRYLRDTEQLETWLNRAIELYEEEADYAAEGERREYYDGADRCRVNLMRVRREPLLQLTLQADRLVYNQSNAIHYMVKNVGWGTARELTLSISGANLQEGQRYDLGTLRRKGNTEGVATVVPTLIGEIMLQVELQGRSKSGELHESLTQTMPVAGAAAEGGLGVSFNTQVGRGTEGLHNLEAPIADRGALWHAGATPTTSSDAFSEAPISPDQLLQQRIESLRRQLVKQYANLNLLEEQAANFPAGQAPVHIQNDIQNTQQRIDEIEELLEELQE
jgi:outer membrane protein assembly factor BamB